MHSSIRLWFPEFITVIPPSITSQEELIGPSLVTFPILPIKVRLTFKRLEFDMFKVKAKKWPPVTTEPVVVITRAFGFKRQIEAVDLIKPAMEDMPGTIILFRVAPEQLLKNKKPPFSMKKLL